MSTAKAVLSAVLVIVGVAPLPATAKQTTYAWSDYSGTPGSQGWTYSDTLSGPLVWDGSIWRCAGYLGPDCYWTSLGASPGLDRNVSRRWTAPVSGSARVSGWTYKDSNYCDQLTDGVISSIRQNAGARFQRSWYLSCNNTTGYYFDVDLEISAGDTLDFAVDRRSNNSSDVTWFYPTIVVDDADPISLTYQMQLCGGAKFPCRWTTQSTSWNVDYFTQSVGFNACLIGQACADLPADSFTIQDLSNGSITTAPNAASAGNPVNFAVTYGGRRPNTTYSYKIKAYRGGRLYGQTKTVTLTTPALPPPVLSPVASVTTSGDAVYGARRAVVSWQRPWAPLDTPQYLERFEVYRQALGSRAPVWFTTSGGVSGDSLCSMMPQGTYPGDWLCTSTSAGSCSATLAAGQGASCSLWDPPVRVGYTTWTAGNTALVWTDTADQASPTFAASGAPMITSIVDPGVDRKPTRYRYSVVARYYGLAPPVRSESTAAVLLPRADTVAGFADTHVHQFANLAHGGRVISGRPGDGDDGSATYDGRLFLYDTGFYSNATGSALRSCGPVTSGGTGAHDAGWLGNLIIQASGAHSDDGIKNLSKWIDHKNSLHQQVYKTALKRAWQGGLRLMVMQAVHSEFLCKAVAALNGAAPHQSALDCRDSVSLDGQIRAALRLQEEIDRESSCFGSSDVGVPDTNLDNNCGWYRIVTTPAAARKAIRAGKLAVILGLETGTVFDCGTGATNTPWGGGTPAGWDGVAGNRTTCHFGGIGGLDDPTDGNSLQHFYDEGVRHVFPIHAINNGLGSAGLFEPDDLYSYNQERINGGFFRTGNCLQRQKAGFNDPPYQFRLDSTALQFGLGPFGKLDLSGLVGLTALPAGYPGVTGATCNQGGVFGDTTPAFGLTPLGRTVIQQMMKKRMLIDIDHMSELSHIDTIAESKKSFNYPVVSGHATLNKLAITKRMADEVALSTVELEEVRASGGQVNLFAGGNLKASDIAQHQRLGGNSAASRFQPQASLVAHDCDHSAKSWVQLYLAAVDLARNAPLPDDNSEPGVYGVGFGSDFNTMMSMLQPRFGYDADAKVYTGCGASQAWPTSSQQAQLNANAAGGPGKAVQYDVDLITGASSPLYRGYGGIDTSMPSDPDNNFPGFNGPRVPRSRLNEGGFLFVLFGEDKPVNGSPGGSVPEKCLDTWGYTGTYDYPRIDDCQNGRKPEQQWRYQGSYDLKIRPLADPGKCLYAPWPAVKVNASCTSDCDYVVRYETTCDGGADFFTLPSGQLQHLPTGLCLSTEGRGYGNGSRVVLAACTGGSTGLAYRPDQFWSRGSKSESYNSTGLSHIGMYPDLIQDLKNVGLTNRDLLPLFQSAEGYLEMWERTGWTRPVDYAALSSNGTWKYSTTPPDSGWQSVTYDDTAWRSVGDDGIPPAFGAAPWYTNVAGFPVPTPARWLPIAPGNATFYFRKAFVSDASNTLRVVKVSADNAANIYFDGVLVASTNDWQQATSVSFLPSSYGVHVIAIEGTNLGGPGGVLVDVR